MHPLRTRDLPEAGTVTSRSQIALARTSTMESHVDDPGGVPHRSAGCDAPYSGGQQWQSSGLGKGAFRWIRRLCRRSGTMGVLIERGRDGSRLLVLSLPAKGRPNGPRRARRNGLVDPSPRNGVRGARRIAGERAGKTARRQTEKLEGLAAGSGSWQPATIPVPGGGASRRAESHRRRRIVRIVATSPEAPQRPQDSPALGSSEVNRPSLRARVDRTTGLSHVRA